MGVVRVNADDLLGDDILGDVADSEAEDQAPTPVADFFNSFEDYFDDEDIA